MPNIRPISDLPNHFKEIMQEVYASNEPVFLTKNGVGSMVVMSMEAYEKHLYESQIYDKLIEAEILSRESSRRMSHRHVMQSAQAIIARQKKHDDNAV